MPATTRPRRAAAAKASRPKLVPEPKKKVSAKAKPKNAAKDKETSAGRRTKKLATRKKQKKSNADPETLVGDGAALSPVQKPLNDSEGKLKTLHSGEMKSKSYMDKKRYGKNLLPGQVYCREHFLFHVREWYARENKAYVTAKERLAKKEKPAYLDIKRLGEHVQMPSGKIVKRTADGLWFELDKTNFLPGPPKPTPGKFPTDLYITSPMKMQLLQYLDEAIVAGHLDNPWGTQIWVAVAHLEYATYFDRQHHVVWRDGVRYREVPLSELFPEEELEDLSLAVDAPMEQFFLSQDATDELIRHTILEYVDNGIVASISHAQVFRAMREPTVPLRCPGSFGLQASKFTADADDEDFFARDKALARVLVTALADAAFGFLCSGPETPWLTALDCVREFLPAGADDAQDDAALTAARSELQALERDDSFDTLVPFSAALLAVARALVAGGHGDQTLGLVREALRLETPPPPPADAMGRRDESCATCGYPTEHEDQRLPAAPADETVAARRAALRTLQWAETATADLRAQDHWVPALDDAARAQLDLTGKRLRFGLGWDGFSGGLAGVLEAHAARLRREGLEGDEDGPACGLADAGHGAHDTECPDCEERGGRYLRAPVRLGVFAEMLARCEVLCFGPLSFAVDACAGVEKVVVLETPTFDAVQDWSMRWVEINRAAAGVGDTDSGKGAEGGQHLEKEGDGGEEDPFAASKVLDEEEKADLRLWWRDLEPDPSCPDQVE